MKDTRIAQLNDQMRTTGTGMWLTTAGINVLEPYQIGDITDAVREFDDFDDGNDPYGEHDFGSVTVGGVEVFWKIDYYAMEDTGDPNDAALESLDHGSEDPANPRITKRVLTIMLASEY